MSAEERQQFLTRMKDRGADVSAFAPDAREGLVQFLGQMGPRILGPTGTLESLTLIEDTTESSKHVRKYLAAFASGARMIWTVVQSSDCSIWLDGTSA